jgi:hypothetical protein
MAITRACLVSAPQLPLMILPVACARRLWRSFGRLIGPWPLAWIWVWSWDPLRFARRHPPHHLSPARVKRQAGPDPEAGLTRLKSPQQRSVQARMPVNSEHDCCWLGARGGARDIAGERNSKNVFLAGVTINVGQESGPAFICAYRLSELFEFAKIKPVNLHTSVATSNLVERKNCAEIIVRSSKKPKERRPRIPTRSQFIGACSHVRQTLS